MTSSEACQIQLSSGEQLQEGHTLKLSQPSRSKAYGLKEDGCDSPHFNCPSNRQPDLDRNSVATSADPALSQL